MAAGTFAGLGGYFGGNAMVRQKPHLLVAVVDDDSSLREAIKSLLDSAGIRTESFASAEEFLRSRRVCTPGCLIVDVGLPGMNGLELQQRLTEMGRHIPLVFITANDDPQGRLRAEALRAGAVAFLHKPFRDCDLLHVTQSACERRS
jgi:FixJ family two-component response regulator